MNKSQTPVSPAEQLKREIASMQREVNDLHKKVNLSTIVDRIEDINTKVNAFSKRVSELRKKNYIFDTTLEKNAFEFVKKWQPTHTNIRIKINQEINSLKGDIKPIEAQLVKVSSISTNIPIANRTLKTLDVLVKNLSEKVSASERMLRGMYDSFDRELNLFNKHLTNIEWSVKEFETSNIKLYAQEFLIMGVKCVWTRDGKKDKDDPEGALFLTDQRLIFEQRQEIATKKILFFTKERELKQEVLVEIPIGLVESIQTAKQGIFKNQDYLDFTCASGAQYNQAQFHIQNQNCEDWKALINRVQAGDYDKNRTQELDQDVLEKIKNAPSICPQCGASINVQIIRGMEQFSCEFCGAIIKL
ncbi:MAG TPA: hypothetical protein VK856_14115 [Anaerolineaceae bacterium]|nr:hypothetical protein [Anaerolineaceae bacterium]